MDILTGNRDEAAQTAAASNITHEITEWERRREEFATMPLADILVITGYSSEPKHWLLERINRRIRELREELRVLRGEPGPNIDMASVERSIDDFYHHCRIAD